MVGRDGGQDAALLVRREHLDAPGVARLLGVRGAEEDLDEGGGLVGRVHPGADRDDVGVVVLAAELRRLDAPGEGAAHALDLVRRDLLAVAAAADDDAEGLGVGRGALGGAEAERRVVVLGVVEVGAAVDGLVAVLGEPFDEVVLEFVARMVGAEIHAHTQECGTSGTG
ncbi:putative ribose-5-phosphate isomerase B [Streptomyces sp. Tu6071]|nr:putative ribose-5-phosphate isomerase B [Streptomyces sp. Tu6071]